MEFRPYGDHKIDVTITSVTSHAYVIPKLRPTIPDLKSNFFIKYYYRDNDVKYINITISKF